MPEYLAPGVTIEEIPISPRPIEGVRTDTAGFVGGAERGPEYPLEITSWLQFQRWYGAYTSESYLPDAVHGFFLNGGQRCYVTRVVPTGGAPRPAASARRILDGITFTSLGRGAWGNRIQLKIDIATQNSALWFKLTVHYYRDPPVDPTVRPPDVLEVFDNLTLEEGETNHVLTVVNRDSHLIRVRWTTPPGSPPMPRAFTTLTGGTQGDALQRDDLQGVYPDTTRDPRTDPTGHGGVGLNALASIQEISLLTVPDEVRVPAITAAVIHQCETLRDRVALVTSQQTSNAALLKAHQDSSYAALYYPWIQVYDATTDGTRLIPATGHIAGLIARTDRERGVHKAPANEVLHGVVDLQTPVTKEIQDDLNPHGVNCIRDFRPQGRGIRLYGARTMSSDSQWRYINVRRLFLFLEQSIGQGTRWVVFEPNGPNLWNAVVRCISDFLTTVWRNGALVGATRKEAFFVKCDRTTMTRDDLDNGRLICDIGVAPVKPAEFVIFRFGQKTAEATE